MALFNFNKDTDVNESEYSDIREYNEITDEQTILDLIGVPVVLDRYINNFEDLMKRTVDICSLCWGNEDDKGETLEHTMIPFKVSVEDHETYEMPLNGFMFFLVFVRPVSQHIRDIKISDFIFECPLIEKTRDRLIDQIRNVLQMFGHPMHEIYDKVADVILHISELNLVFSYAAIQIFTAENLFLDHYRDSELIRDINNTYYPSNIQTSEIVEENEKKYKLLKDEMIKRGNPLFIDDQYTKILKPKQIEELYINFAQIPDGKDIIPVIMNGNGFNSGYKEPEVLYAAAVGARVPDLMNNEYMGPAGYFARNIWILTYGTVSKTVHDCGSVNPIPIVITENNIKSFDGRYYYEEKHSGVLRMLDSKRDKHLIGKTLWFRSPCTCNLNEDVCHICYGNKALRVGDLSGGFVYTSQVMTSRINKNILSAKHLLKANAEKIVYSPSFEKYFEIDSSQVYVNPDAKRFDIYVKEDYLDELSEKFTMYIGKDREEVIITNYANIHIPDDLFKKAKVIQIDEETYYKLNSDKVEDSICMLTPINIMMTAKYNKMMNLLNQDIAKMTDISEAVTEMCELFNGSIPLLSTHAEVILSRLIKSPDDDMKRPNWLNYDEPYKLVRVNTALDNTESFTAALASQQTNHHLRHAIFDKRNKINRVGLRSFMDYLFGYHTL